MRDGGRVITLGAPPDAGLAGGRDVRDEFFVVRPDRAQLEQLGALVDAGAVRPLVGDCYRLSEGADAYRARGRRGGPGKTVLMVR